MFILAASLPSLDNGRREKLGSIPRREDAIRPVHKLSKDGADEDTIDGTMLELSDLLGRTVASAVLQAAEEPDDWSPHPAYILASQMKDRLETPHELATTMEQYEEVTISHLCGCSFVVLFVGCFWGFYCAVILWYHVGSLI